MRLSPVIASLALVVAGCSAPAKPGATPAPAATVPGTAPAPAASTPQAATSRESAGLDVPTLKLPPSTFAQPGEIPITKLEQFWDDTTGCGPQLLVTSSDTAFLLCSRQGEIMRVGADKESRVIYRNEAQLNQAVVAGDQIVVGQMGAGNGVLISVPLAGGPFRVMTRSIDGPHGLAADATAAYVVSQLKILRVTRNGDERVLARTTGVVSALDARGGELYFLDSRQPTPAAPMRTFLFRARGTADPVAVATFDENPDHVFSDDQAVYVHLAGRNEIVRMPKTGAPHIVTKTSGVSLRPVSDGKHIYWLDQVGPTANILRAKVTGGPAEAVIRPEQDQAVSSFGVTDQHVVLLVSAGQTRLVRWKKP